MKEKNIFRIDINRVPEQEYYLLFNKKKADILKNVAEPCYPVLTNWAYYKGNCRIGFLEITITNTDIFIEPYISSYKRTRIFSYKKHQIKYYQMSGNHFPIFDCKTNLDVYKKIKEKISIIMKSFPNCSLDIEAFDNIGEYIDYLSMKNHI